MARPKVILFDVNETLLDLTPVKESVGKALDGRPELAPLWFTTLLQYSLVATVAGRRAGPGPTCPSACSSPPTGGTWRGRRGPGLRLPSSPAPDNRYSLSARRLTSRFRPWPNCRACWNACSGELVAESDGVTVGRPVASQVLRSFIDPGCILRRFDLFQQPVQVQPPSDHRQFAGWRPGPLFWYSVPI